MWPTPTHGAKLKPYLTAAGCIDWSIQCPSIFERKRPLKEATLRRIANGIRKFVIESANPFIMPLTHQGADRGQSLDNPMNTVTGAHRGELALVTPYVAKFRHDSAGSSLNEPLHTVTAGGDMKRPAGAAHAMALVAPTLIQTGYGERNGQAPRSLDLQKPLGTVVANGQKHALVAAFLAKHFGGHETPGTPLDKPTGTITGQDHHALVTSHLLKLKGTCKDGQAVDEPIHTVQAGGNHYGEVRAFLIQYYSQGSGKRARSLEEPTPTLTAVDRLGLVTIHGVDYAIVDIGMRMLQPHELFLAQGFPADYVIAPYAEVMIGRGAKRRAFNRKLSKTAQVRMCGNSVCPPLSEALVRANFKHEQSYEAVA